MQDRYTGDIGDFGKYALLKALAGDDLRLGVNWYLNPDEEGNRDGGFVAYPKLRDCDPPLHDCLMEIVRRGERRVAAVECSGILPADTARRTREPRDTAAMEEGRRALPHARRPARAQRQTGFIAVTQNLDTDESNPMARFMLHIMAAFAELEREIIRERVVAGVKAARANGKQLGRPKRVFRRDEAARLRADGMSWRKIAAELRVPVTTVVEACRGERR